MKYITQCNLLAHIKIITFQRGFLQAAIVLQDSPVSQPVQLFYMVLEDKPLRRHSRSALPVLRRS